MCVAKGIGDSPLLDTWMPHIRFYTISLLKEKKRISSFSSYAIDAICPWP